MRCNHSFTLLNMSSLYQLSTKTSCIVWLNSDNPDDSMVKLLGPIWKAILVLHDVHQCSELIRLIYEEKVILIISEGFLQVILPLVHSMPQIDSIYIDSKEQTNVEQWKGNWSKIKGSFSDLSFQCRLSERFSLSCNRTPISINTLPSDRSISDQSSNQFDPTFIWTQLFKELISEDSHDPKQLEKMFNYLRQKFANNDDQRQKIYKLQKDYDTQRPIYWYTSEPLLYSNLNEALRMQDIEAIIRFGPYLHDLHHDLKRLHSESFSNLHSDTLTVYRGQAMHKADFDRLEANRGGLLSFNCFLSTSIAESVGNFFADSNSGSSDQNMVAVLFVITIATSQPGASYARIAGISQYDVEQEVLFSTHTIFRIKDIAPNHGNDRIRRVQLELTDENDEQLKNITERFRNQLDHGLPSRYRIPSLLTQLMREDLALRLYQELLEVAHGEEEKAFLYGRIGTIKSNNDDYVDAQSDLKEAISIYENSIVNNTERQFLINRHAAEIYSAMGTLCRRRNHMGNALKYYTKAMLTDPNVLDSYIHAAQISTNMGEYHDALDLYSTMLQWLEHYPEDHPDVAFFRDELAYVHMLLNNNEEALVLFNKALASREITCHPSLGSSYEHLGEYYAKMEQFNRADKFFQKALKFYQTSPLSDRNLSHFYRKLGKFNGERKMYPLAEDWLNKSLEIMQRISTDPDDHLFVGIYYEQAVMYLAWGKYNKAEPLFNKALKIWQKSVIETNDMGTCYSQMGVLYYEQKCYLKALFFFKKALEILERTSQENPSNLLGVYNNVAAAHVSMGDICRSLSCCIDALRIAEKKLPENDPIMQTMRKNKEIIEHLCNQRQEAEIYWPQQITLCLR